jgi:hypothetical protein
MYRSGLDGSMLFVTELGLDSDALSKALAKVEVDRIGGDIHQSGCTERNLKVFDAPLVRFVCFRSA